MDLRVTGTIEEIGNFTTALTIAGYKFNRDHEYYPQKGSAERFSLYLKFVKLPPGATEPPVTIERSCAILPNEQQLQ